MDVYVHECFCTRNKRYRNGQSATEIEHLNTLMNVHINEFLQNQELNSDYLLKGCTHILMVMRIYE